MTEREAFLKAIREAPDDDDLRLVFADWLEENGDPQRAQFIRLSIAAARLPEGQREPPELFDERIDLFHAIDEHVYKELRVFKGIQWMDGFSSDQRGLFESAVVLSPKTLVAEADKVWSLTCLRFLTLQNPQLTSLKAVLALPHLRCLLQLRITGRWMVDDEAIAAVVASPNLTGLRGLYLAEGSITNKGVALLAEAPLIDQLRSLDLEKNPSINPEGEQAKQLQKRCAGHCALHLSRPRRRRQ